MLTNLWVEITQFPTTNTKKFKILQPTTQNTHYIYIQHIFIYIHTYLLQHIFVHRAKEALLVSDCDSNRSGLPDQRSVIEPVLHEESQFHRYQFLHGGRQRSETVVTPSK